MTETKSTALEEKKTTKVAKLTPEERVCDMLQSEKAKAEFAKALPKHIQTEKFVRIAVTEIRNNPELAKCSQESLLGALMQSAQLGLEPGILDQCYLIPYKGECTFQLGYKGMIELLRRTGQLKDIFTACVHEGDKFKISLGLHKDLIHEPAMADRGAVIGYYAVALLKDGTVSFEYMTKAEVVTFAKAKSMTFNNPRGPWQTDFDPMACKTVAKKLLKWLPASTELIEAMRTEDGDKEPSYIVDESTGEVIER